MAIIIRGIDDTRVSYEGCVLDTGEMNGYHDSDFYAVVWDESEQRVKRVEYATTRFHTYGNHAIVDAAPEVKRKAAAYLADLKLARILEQNRAEAHRILAGLERGEEVEVIRGRKVAIGTQARVFWIGESRWGERVGLELQSGERVFTARTNVRSLEKSRRRRLAGESIRARALADHGSRAALRAHLAESIEAQGAWRSGTATNAAGWRFVA